jgi:hypothetical protein
MSEAAPLALQKAVFAALAADSALLAALGGEARIFDGPPRNAAPPYLHLGELTLQDWSTGTEAGAEVLFSVVCWSRASGRAESLALAELARAALDGAALTVAGYRLVNLRHLRTETGRADSPDGRRATARFRAVLEPQG